MANDRELQIDRIATGPMELVHWPECRGGDACQCADSGSFILTGVGYVRRHGDPFVLARIDAFTEATRCGDTAGAHEEFLQLANRCAQALLYLDDLGMTLPPDNHPYWESRRNK